MVTACVRAAVADRSAVAAATGAPAEARLGASYAASAAAETLK